ncbi:MAG: GNAT family N-acetyltransferase [Clostridia bacterium]|nr:GNAT family N-acetyltransferase [Clostridia bacterium]
MEKDLIIRCARREDAGSLLEIYAPYVEKTAITFEYEVPAKEEFAARMEKVMEKYPYLVAERDGEILGYAYASPFHSRAAYGWCVETSIYVDMEKRSGGIGGALYNRLEEALKAQGILNLNACIGFADPEDEYLKNDSVSFHAHFGYSMVGRFHRCGWKFGRWYDMVWMEKMLGDHGTDVKPVKRFDEVRAELKL